MRINHSPNRQNNYKILILDDEEGIIKSIGVLLKRSGYYHVGVTNPVEAIERVRSEAFDLLILDYIMEPLHGDQVVEQIRKFNDEIYILLLTGHKDLAPPLETIKALDIQAYCEKSDKFDQLMLLIESAIKSISQMRTIKSFKDGLNKILQAVPKIYQLQPIDNILEEILAGILPLVHSDNAFILVDDYVETMEITKDIIFKGIGIYNTDLENFLGKITPELFEKLGNARLNKQIIKFESGIIFPLINDTNNVIGTIYIESRDFEDGLKLVEIYASQAASSLNNAILHSMVNIKNEELNKTYRELQTRYMETIEALRLAVDAKDFYTRGHSDRVAFYALKLGEAFSLSSKELELLRISGIFHDIGKIGTTDDILLKVGKLTEKEYQEIKKHPIKGASILSAVSMFKEIVPVIQCHHERIDGKGYPMGLKGDQIPFLAKILAVADAFDAMTSDRLYRTKLGLDEAISQLIAGAGTQFDAEIIDKFIGLLNNYSELQKEIAYSFEPDDIQKLKS
jgi:putative nucleotidyltransferase with HDIG domain